MLVLRTMEGEIVSEVRASNVPRFERRINEPGTWSAEVVLGYGGSAAEDLFIELFSETFGAEKTKYLYSQYHFYDIYQNSRYADFMLESGVHRIAIEIEAVSSQSNTGNYCKYGIHSHAYRYHNCRCHAAHVARYGARFPKECQVKQISGYVPVDSLHKESCNCCIGHSRHGR